MIAHLVEMLIAAAAYEVIKDKRFQGDIVDAACDAFGEFCRGRPYAYQRTYQLETGKDAALEYVA